MRKLSLLKNNLGLSMLQLLISAGLMSGLSLMASQLIARSKNIVDRDIKKENTNMFFDERFRTLSTSAACNLNFANKNHTRNVQNIVDKNNVEILRVNTRYLNNTIEVRSMNVAMVDATSVRFSVGYVPYPSPNSTPNITKTLTIPVTIENNQVKECYYLFNITSITDSASSACIGNGVVIQNDRCWFKNIMNPNYVLPLGYGVNQIIDDPSDKYYKRINNMIFSPPGNSSCPHEKVGGITQYGSVLCLNMDSLVDSTTATFSAGSSCNLKNSAGKIALHCCGGAPPPPTCITDGTVCIDVDDCANCCSGFPLTNEDPQNFADCSHGGFCGGECRPNLHNLPGGN